MKNGNLTQNQSRAVDKFISQRNRYGALFMDAGTGKTRTIIEILSRIPCEKVVWLSKKTLKQNTLDEFEKWGFNKEVAFFGIDSLKNSMRITEEAIEFAKNNDNVALVFDESTLIKNPNSNSFLKAKEIRNHCDFSFILNGTPLTQSFYDIWCQMNILSDKILGSSFDEFKDMIEKKKKITYSKKKGNKFIKVEKEWVEEFKNIEIINKLIAPYIVEADMILDSEIIEDTVTVDLTDETKEELDKYLSGVLKDSTVNNYKEIEFKSFVNRLGENVALSIYQKVQHIYSADENRLKKLGEIIDDDTLVFVKYQDTEKAVEKLINKKNSKARVLTYGKGAVGLNLQQYNKTIYFDLTFDYYTKKQSFYRTYRTGQKADQVKYFNFESNFWLDEMMCDNLSKKSKLKDMIGK